MVNDFDDDLQQPEGNNKLLNLNDFYSLYVLYVKAE